MVDGMRGLEDGRAVHPAMRPVEPGVVRKEIEQHRHRQIPERPGMGIGVDPRPPAILPAPGDDPGRHAVDRGGGQAPPDLASDLRIEPGIQVRMPRPRRQRKRPRRQQIADTDDQRHGDGGQDQGKRHGGLVPYRGRGLNREPWMRGLLFARGRGEVRKGVGLGCPFGVRLCRTVDDGMACRPGASPPRRRANTTSTSVQAERSRSLRLTLSASASRALRLRSVRTEVGQGEDHPRWKIRIARS